MSLDQIRVEGYKSLRALGVDLLPINVLIGANGAGKSNFVSLFRLLNRIVEKNLQLYVAQEGGADALLHLGRKVTESITINLNFGRNAYRCVLEPTVDDRLFFSQEVIYYHGTGFAQPWNLMLDQGHRESKLPDEATGPGNRIAKYVLGHLLSWQVYHFHDTSDSAGVKQAADTNDNAYLRRDASNLAAFLFRLRASARSNYDAIRDSIRLVAPFFDDFVLRPSDENKKKIRLEWRELR